MNFKSMVYVILENCVFADYQRLSMPFSSTSQKGDCLLSAIFQVSIDNLQAAAGKKRLNKGEKTDSGSSQAYKHLMAPAGIYE